jgi:CubicO group peptidase (beta-lactamase class C family)
MSAGAMSKARLHRMHDVMAGHVERGDVPGMVTLISRRGDVHVDAIGLKTAGSSDPMRRDTMFRIASLTKPITAAAAMILVEECRLRLDEPIDRFLPELANRKVLKRLDGPLYDTVPARRPISLRDLLTLRMGFGYIMEGLGAHPIQKAANDQMLLMGPPKPQSLPAPDEWIRRLGSLPLMHQPGDKWMYDLGFDVLGVLIARASGQAFETFLRERIFEPLGMKDTGFSVPAAKLDRLATSYESNPDTGALEVYDSAGDHSHWSRPPAFPSGSGGLVSTIDDYLAFGQMMLHDGKYRGERILSRRAVELMTCDHLTREQKAENPIFFGGNSGWGFGVSVITEHDDLYAIPGRYGWDGGLGTSWASDPLEEMVAILMTQRAMDSPRPPDYFLDFWTSVYQAIDD